MSAPFSDRLAQLGPAFRWLMLSDAQMLLAIMVGQVALPWWIAGVGGAHDLAVYSIWSGACAIVAMPLLSPLGDRVPKRRMIRGALVTYAAASAGVAVLASLHLYSLPLLLVLGIGPVLAMAALTPATASFVAELVPPSQLSTALGLQQSAQSAGRMIGPALGGAVLGVAGVATTLWMGTGLLLGASVAARRLPIGHPPARSRRRWHADVVAGLRVNWRIPIERGWILVNFASWVFLMPCFTMLVPLKVKSLGLTGTWLGLCEAGLSLGVLLGSLGGAMWAVGRFGRFRTRVGAAVAQGFALGLAGMTDNGPLLVAAFVVAGLMNAAMVLVGMTHRMLARPLAYRARMVASAVATTNIASVIGPALAGVALLHVEVATVFVAFGVAGGLCAAGLWFVPGFRDFMALDHEQVDGFYAKRFPQAFAD